MKKKFALFSVILMFIIAITTFANPVFADQSVYLGGMPAGFMLKTRGVEVVGFCDVVGIDGTSSPAKKAELSIGDVILEINGKEVNSAKDVGKNLSTLNDLTLSIKRKGEKIEKIITPARDFNGDLKLGVFVRDNVSGIGTITYIKDGKFASLGHPILDGNGDILDLISGDLFSCVITGCLKGEKGFAGELRGVFMKNKNVGKIEKNLNNGVFGSLNSNFDYKKLKKIELGHAVPGGATIISTINGDETKEYSISIVKVDNLSNSKNIVIKITDNELIEATGGIVQGMSGSPIIQSGKLVGAVTHVFINDSTRGFGIDIENMLNN